MFTYCHRAQGLCESRGGRPGLPVPNSPYGLCGRKATFNEQLGVGPQRPQKQHRLRFIMDGRGKVALGGG